MIQYKIKFVTENNGEETEAAEYTVTVHQYMNILAKCNKLKGVR